MIVRELLETVDRLHPNQFSIDDKLRWLNEVEQMIWREIITTHEGVEEDAEMPVYTASDMDSGADTELLAKDPDSRLYPAWMDAQIAYYNRESMKYSDAIVAFNEAYSTYFNAYNRTHMPLRSVDHLHLVDRRW